MYRAEPADDRSGKRGRSNTDDGKLVEARPQLVRIKCTARPAGTAGSAKERVLYRLWMPMLGDFWRSRMAEEPLPVVGERTVG